ncbi:S-adenosyl-L-methionine-dependent methyltransferase [Phlyctochytrium arcticum]|nr:S-adenosyl-L-methionine-dependent methyltransferase [Phlyctochytrium arcticum]
MTELISAKREREEPEEATGSGHVTTGEEDSPTKRIKTASDSADEKGTKVDDKPVVEKAPDADSRSRLRLDNLPKHCGKKDILKICTKEGVEEIPQVKKAPTWEYAYLSFMTEESRIAAKAKLEGAVFKNQKLTVSDAVQHARSGMANMRGRSQRDVAASNADDTRTTEERLADQVTPLWRKAYSEQLKGKQQKLRSAMVKFRTQMTRYLTKEYLRAGCPEPQTLDITPQMSPEDRAIIQLAWLRTAAAENENMACPLLEIMPSPIEKFYRNKCEFTFGWDDKGEKCVGFLLGLFKEGVVNVLPPTDSLHVSPAARDIAAALQTFLRASDLDIYDRIQKKGFWRMTLVRTHTTGENMVIVQYNPKDVPADKIQTAVSELSAHMQAAKSSDGNPLATTLLVQEWEGVFNGFPEDALMKVVYGSGFVHEKLLGLTFRISPTAFFQINTPATEKLYSLVRDWCALDKLQPAASLESNEPKLLAAGDTDGSAEPQEAAPGTILLDLCCGTGTIGLTMASHVKKVVGVDIIKEAIADAEFNAVRNHLDNVSYYANKVEAAIKLILKEHVGPQDNVVAVLDPPRSGVHADVIKAVRACKRISNVIYVSCDPNQACTNFTDLCRPTSNKFEGKPFQPVRAQPVDLFPHTDHCELVLEFKR